jgi:hypothetical protein
MPANPTVRAITIRQPFASLCAAGIKRFEARTWDTPYRGWVAIHAGTAITRGIDDLYEDSRVRRALEKLTGVTNGHLPDAVRALPRSAFVGVVKLVDVLGEIEDVPDTFTFRDLALSALPGEHGAKLHVYRDARLFREPVAYKAGMLNLWHPPAAVATKLADLARLR